MRIFTNAITSILSGQAGRRSRLQHLSRLHAALCEEGVTGEDFAQAGIFIAPYKRDHAYVGRKRLGDKTTSKPQLGYELEMFYALLETVTEHGRTLLKAERLFVLWQAVYNSRHAAGAACEIGSFRGGSAYFIASARQHLRSDKTPFHVIDTFAGHPEHLLNQQRDGSHTTALFRDTSYESVRDYLSPFGSIIIHPIAFREAVADMHDEAYSFVHIDVDTYQSTLDCLDYFIPRMSVGGVIIVDDFAANKCQGVADAVNERLTQLQQFSLWQMQTEQLAMVRLEV